MKIEIRDETPGDIAAIRALNLSAFESEQEANIVDALRGNGAARLSLVATIDGTVVGHIMYSPINIAGKLEGAALGPMAVLPGYQRTQRSDSEIAPADDPEKRIFQYALRSSGFAGIRGDSRAPLHLHIRDYPEFRNRTTKQLFAADERGRTQIFFLFYPCHPRNPRLLALIRNPGLFARIARVQTKRHHPSIG